MKEVNKQQVPSEQKAPITLGLLHCVIEVVSMVVNDTYKSMLYTAIFNMLYHGCMRVGECLFTTDDADYALRENQITFRLDGVGNPVSLAIRFDQFKSSQSRRVPPLLVPGERDSRYCPARLVYQYHIIKPKNTAYYFVNEDGTRVLASSAQKILHDCMQRLGLNPADYSCHSFRAGKTTDMVSQGRGSAGIRAVGRWMSSAHEVYNRPAFLLS